MDVLHRCTYEEFLLSTVTKVSIPLGFLQIWPFLPNSRQDIYATVNWSTLRIAPPVEFIKLWVFATRPSPNRGCPTQT